MHCKVICKIKIIKAMIKGCSCTKLQHLTRDARYDWGIPWKAEPVYE